MINETKKTKVENLVNEINKIHDKKGNIQIKSNEALRLIFNYDDLNEFGKIIIKKAAFMKFTDKKISEDVAKRRIITEEFVSFCSNGYLVSEKQAFYFIFWALMIVAFDNSKKEEYLSIICDYAKMLMITDEEIKDIVEIIKIVLNKSNEEVLSYECPSALDYEQKQKLYEKKFIALKNTIKSQRTYRAFSTLLEVYVGIDEDKMKRYINLGEIYVPTWF